MARLVYTAMFLLVCVAAVWAGYSSWQVGEQNARLETELSILKAEYLSRELFQANYKVATRRITRRALDIEDLETRLAHFVDESSRLQQFDDRFLRAVASLHDGTQLGKAADESISEFNGTIEELSRELEIYIQGLKP